MDTGPVLSFALIAVFAPVVPKPAAPEPIDGSPVPPELPSSSAPAPEGPPGEAKAAPPDDAPPDDAPPDDAAPEPGPPPDDLPPAEPCPCDEIDWQCIQTHPKACKRDEGAEEPPQRESPDSPAASAPPETAKPPPRFVKAHRWGPMLGVGLGYATCTTDYCDGFKGAFVAQVEAGWRFRYVAPLMSIAVGGGPFRLKGWTAERPDSGRLAFFDVAFGALAFPVRHGRVDPYFGVALGYSQTSTRLSFDQGAGDVGGTGGWKFRRGSVRLTAGLAVYATQRLSLGPRFDISLPFAGTACIGGDFEWTFADDRCIDMDELATEGLTDPADLPKPFSVTLHLRVMLPPSR